MRFYPPLPSVYFEQNQKSEIRAFFYSGEVPQGHSHYVATLSLSGNLVVGPTMEERFGLDDASTWPTNILDWKTSPVDLSFLNAPEKPAGKHGFLRPVNGKLVFEDGTQCAFGGPTLRQMRYSARAPKTSSFRLIACRSWASISCASSTTTCPGSSRISSATSNVAGHEEHKLRYAGKAGLVDQVSRGRRHLRLVGS